MADPFRPITWDEIDKVCNEQLAVRSNGLLAACNAVLAARAYAESPACPDCGTALHLVCLECHPVADGGAVRLDDETQRRDVEAYLDDET